MTPDAKAPSFLGAAASVTHTEPKLASPHPAHSKRFSVSCVYEGRPRPLWPSHLLSTGVNQYGKFLCDRKRLCLSHIINTIPHFFPAIWVWLRPLRPHGVGTAEWRSRQLLRRRLSTRGGRSQKAARQPARKRLDHLTPAREKPTAPGPFSQDAQGAREGVHSSCPPPPRSQQTTVPTSLV